MEENLLLEVNNVSKVYGKNRSILDNINFKLYENEILGIIGKSGSGKSTLGKLCCGLEPVTSGNIIYKDDPVPIIKHGNRNIKKFPIQLIMQNAKGSFDPHYTLEDALMDVARKNCDINSASHKIEKILLDCGLGMDLLKKYPGELSGGQIQRMAIARVLLSNPKVIVADEIISALDIPIQLQIINLLKNLTKQYKLGILFIVHDLNALKLIANRVIVLDQGRIVFNGEYEKLHYAENGYIKNLMEVLEFFRL